MKKRTPRAADPTGIMIRITVVRDITAELDKLDSFECKSKGRKRIRYVCDSFAGNKGKLCETFRPPKDLVLKFPVSLEIRIDTNPKGRIRGNAYILDTNDSGFRVDQGQLIDYLNKLCGTNYK